MPLVPDKLCDECWLPLTRNQVRQGFRHCSYLCRDKALRKDPFAYLKASILIDTGGCWIWQKAISKGGYGRACINGRKNLQAHRLSYELFYGVPPETMHVHHRCANPRCCNPQHLELLTPMQHQTVSPNVYKNKTRCKQGHAFNKENTYKRRNGGRKCRICMRIQEEKRKPRKHARS